MTGRSVAEAWAKLSGFEIVAAVLDHEYQYDADARILGTRITLFEPNEGAPVADLVIEIIQLLRRGSSKSIH